MTLAPAPPGTPTRSRNLRGFSLTISDKYAHTLSGTKPYMAPEVFYSAASPLPTGYSYPADWWSLGVTAYELKTGARPFEINSRTSLATTVNMFKSCQGANYPEKWSPEFTKFIQVTKTEKNLNLN